MGRSGQHRVLALIEELGLSTFPTHTSGRHILELGNSRIPYTGRIPLFNPLAMADVGRAQWELRRAARRIPLGDPPATPLGDKLPASIGGPALRAAALYGDAAAAYEVGTRFADGHGVPRSNESAALWFERAAEQGLVPAQFRLGGFYEKGIGVKKDFVAARDLYLAAARKGNGKAMQTPRAEHRVNNKEVRKRGAAKPRDHSGNVYFQEDDRTDHRDEHGKERSRGSKEPVQLGGGPPADAAGAMRKR